MTLSGRESRIAKAFFTGLLARLITSATPLITIPITLGYLGKAKYGAWMVLTSVNASVSFTDLGIGLGLLNSISECYALASMNRARELVSSALTMLSAISALLGLVVIACWHWLNWATILPRLRADDEIDVRHAACILAACFLLNLPVSIVEKINLAVQESSITGIYQTLASIISLSGVLVATRLDLGLPGIVLAANGSLLLGNCINAFQLFVYRHPYLRPNFRLASYRDMRKLLRTGSFFLVMQLCYLVSYTSDNLVIARCLSLSAVAEYAPIARLFSSVNSLVSLITTPLWPAFNEAATKGDALWVRKALYRICAGILLGTIICNSLLYLVGNRFLSAWTHSEINPSHKLLFALALWGIIGSLAGATSYFMNAMNVFRYQAIGAILMAGLNLSLSIWLTKTVGTSGVVWGSIAAQSLMLIPTMLSVIPTKLKELSGQRDCQDAAKA